MARTATINFEELGLPTAGGMVGFFDGSAEIDRGDIAYLWLDNRSDPSRPYCVPIGSWLFRQLCISLQAKYADEIDATRPRDRHPPIRVSDYI